MSKKSRERRSRDRIDVRLWERRDKKYDLLRWQFPEWNKERIRQIERWENSMKVFTRSEDEVHVLYFNRKLIHKGRKP